MIDGLMVFPKLYSILIWTTQDMSKITPPLENKCHLDCTSLTGLPEILLCT